MIDLAATDRILENGTSNTSIAYVAALLICKDNVIKKNTGIQQLQLIAVSVWHLMVFTEGAGWVMVLKKFGGREWL